MEGEPDMDFEKQTPLWFRWLGYHGLEFRIGEDILHLNPFFTRVPQYKHKLNLLKTDREMIRQELKNLPVYSGKQSGLAASDRYPGNPVYV